MCDPYVKGRYNTYKQMAVKKQGPSFLERMYQDKETRQRVQKTMQSRFSLDQLKIELNIDDLNDRDIDHVLNPKQK